MLQDVSMWLLSCLLSSLFPLSYLCHLYLTVDWLPDMDKHRQFSHTSKTQLAFSGPSDIFLI